MNKIYLAYQDANLRVRKVFDANPEEVAKNSSFATHAAEYGVLVGEITDLEVAAGEIVPTTASSKKQARAHLETVCLQHCKLMYVFAEESNNYQLMDFLKVNKSDYPVLRTADMSIYGLALLKNTTTYADHLVAVGIGEEQIVELTEANTVFMELMEDPREQINKRKDILTSIEEKVEQTKHMLDKVFDYLIESYPSDLQFVKDYKLARIVVDPATHHRTDDDDAPVEE